MTRRKAKAKISEIISPALFLLIFTLPNLCLAQGILPWEILSAPETIFEAGNEFAKVTDTYGKLVVREGKFIAESSIKPWSSWWYPYWKNDYFAETNTEHSILWRYDRFVYKTVGVNPNAEAYEKENLFFPEQARWSGRCDAWAMASIMEPEPTSEIVVKGIKFRIRDQKSLLIKLYEKMGDSSIFGQRYNGDWDSLYGDLYPDQFHKFMQVELFQKKMPFLMDHDAGVEVWNVPVYKAQVTIKKDPNDSRIVHVTNVISTASPHVDNLDFVGTEGVLRIYNYDLFGDFDANGDFIVTHGKWTGNSRRDHPDFVIARPNAVPHSSLNKNIKEEFIRKIFAGTTSNGGNW